MSGVYKRVGRWEGSGVGGGVGWMVGWGGWLGRVGSKRRIKALLELFELAMSPRSASHRPKHAQRA